MYHFSISKVLIYNLALLFLIWAGTVMILRPFTRTPVRALVAGMQVSFATIVVVGFSLYYRLHHIPCTGNHI